MMVVMGGPVGWGPVGVSGACDVPSGHLAFDESRVRACGGRILRRGWSEAVARFESRDY